MDDYTHYWCEGDAEFVKAFEEAYRRSIREPILEVHESVTVTVNNERYISAMYLRHYLIGHTILTDDCGWSMVLMPSLGLSRKTIDHKTGETIPLELGGRLLTITDEDEAMWFDEADSD